jgi:DNA-directed RNA polymerase subunit omega
MARITIEDGLKKGYNKFMLVHLATRRALQLKKGKEPLIECNNREIVAALREIEAGRVTAKPEGSKPEAYLETESQLLAPSDEQIEHETVAETFKEVALESGAEVVDQGEPAIHKEEDVATDEDLDQSDTEEE